MKQRTTNRVVDLYASEIFDTGGIQTYMRSIVRVLAGKGWLRNVVSLKGSPDEGEARDWSDRYGFEFLGADFDKLQFVVDAFRTVETDFAMVGYVTLAPVALLQKKLGLIDGYAVVLHGVEAWEPLGWLLEWALREADAVICTTEFTADKTIELHGVSPDDVEILPLAVEPDRFDVEHLDVGSLGERDAETPFELLTVSRLARAHDYKGVDHTIEAIAHIRGGDDSPPIHYTVVGDGDDRERLEALAERLEVDDVVDFLGRVSDRRLREAFREADAFIMPSSGEGFGLVYVEAMANGLPCIASPEGGAQYVVREGHGGLLAEWGNPEAIAEAILRCADPERYADLARAARKAFEQDFTYERFRSDLAAILSRCIPEE